MSVTHQVLSNLRSGDAGAFTLVFDLYWKKLFNAAYSRIKDEQLAQDIVQDVFMQVWDRRATLNLDLESIEFYLLKSVRNKVINHYLSRQIKEEVLQKVMVRMEEMNQETHDIDRYLELEKFVDRCIEEFPETMRAIFLMRSDKYTIQQISGSLNLAEQTVKNNISEATKRLRKALNKKFRDEQIITAFLIASLLTKS